MDTGLWAYATMGRGPGERVMGMLEGRVGEVVREYNAQDVANTHSFRAHSTRPASFGVAVAADLWCAGFVGFFLAPSAALAKPTCLLPRSNTV